MRLSLGATRGRLIQQLLTESALIGLLAGALGLPLAWAMLRLLIAQVSSALPSYWGAIALQIDPDVRIFTYTLLVSLATGVVFGLAPAWQASRPDVNAALKDEGRALGRAPGRSRLRDVLIAAQIGACLVLLIGSALLLRGSQRALCAEPGFETRHVVSIEVFDPAAASNGPARWRTLKRELREVVGAVPGVSAVAVASRPPIGGGQRWVPLAVAGAPAPPAGEGGPPAVGYSYVSPNFETLGIGVVGGRAFNAGEGRRGFPWRSSARPRRGASGPARTRWGSASRSGGRARAGTSRARRRRCARAARSSASCATSTASSSRSRTTRFCIFRSRTRGREAIRSSCAPRAIPPRGCPRSAARSGAWARASPPWRACWTR